MQKIDVKIPLQKERSYPIFIGENLLNDVYGIIGKYSKARRYLVVTNEIVYSLYGEKLKNENSVFVVLPDGEIYKNTDMLGRILNKALEIKLERTDAIIALGGGVTGDMAGFAASIYQRGVDFIQVPTTLLAQVDSSVGGKVAVNHALGKNMIGSFYQPKVVIADTLTLNTLDERQFKTGLSEVLKYAFIENSCCAEEQYDLFEFLKINQKEIFNKNQNVLKELIKICCCLKAAVVNKDEKESGLRAVLNFGHTYAHAIENLTGYAKYTHGEAVSIGMRLAFELARGLNIISDEYFSEAVNLIKDYGLLTEADDRFNPEEFYNSMCSDKKVLNGRIKFVLPIQGKEVCIKDNIDKNMVLRGI